MNRSTQNRFDTRSFEKFFQTAFVLTVVVGVLFLVGCSVVGPQQRGVRVSFGKVGEILGSGAYVTIPVAYSITKIDVSIQKSEVDANAASKDMQTITTKIAVNWRIDETKLVETFKNIGDEDAVLQRVIHPAVNEVVKAVTAKNNAEEVLTKRMELKNDIDAQLGKRLAAYGVTVSDISIVNIAFGKEFEAAIEAKQVAEQDAKKAVYIAEKSLREADGRRNQAQGEADAQKLLRTNLTDEMIRLKAVEKWDGKLPQFVGQGSIPFIGGMNAK